MSLAAEFITQKQEVAMRLEDRDGSYIAFPNHVHGEKRPPRKFSGAGRA